MNYNTHGGMNLAEVVTEYVLHPCCSADCDYRLPDTEETGEALDTSRWVRYPWRHVIPHCARRYELAQHRAAIYDRAFAAADAAWDGGLKTLRGRLKARERAFRAEADLWTDADCPFMKTGENDDRA